MMISAKRIALFYSLLLGFMLLGVVSLMAQPPKPPAGKVWVKIPAMSDEFDAHSPDTEKWRVFDQGDSWDRTSAFDKRIHEVIHEPKTNNYFLTMNPMWYYEDEQFTKGDRTYLFAGGGMDTRAMATYGYFEVRLKASNFPMGSGVFMNSRKTSSDICDEKYHTELDIIENMSYDGPGANTTGFNFHQNVNSHAKPFKSEGGNCVSLPYESTKSGVKSQPLEGPLDFNTVGMWWKNANEAEFYLNGRAFGTITPTRDFNLPMPVIIVMETYTWGSDENNAGNPKPEAYMFEDEFRTKEQRAVTYDWVRSWQLVDVDASVFNDQNNAIAFHQPEAPTYAGDQLDKTLIYSLAKEARVTTELLRESGKSFFRSSAKVPAGVHSYHFKETFYESFEAGKSYVMIARLEDEGEVLTTDTLRFTPEEEPLENKVFGDMLPTRLEPTSTGYAVEVRYEADGPMEISGEIRDPNNKWLGAATSEPVSGRGVVTLNLPVNSPTTPGAGYYFKAHIRPVGTDWQQAVHAISNAPFTVAEPVTPHVVATEATVELIEKLPVVSVAFDYGAEEDVDFHLTLTDENFVPKAEKLREERLGARALTRSIFSDSALAAGENYKVIVTMTYQQTQEIFADTLEGITITNPDEPNEVLSVEQKSTLLVYPTPAYDQVNVRLAAPMFASMQSVRVYDVSGNALSVPVRLDADSHTVQLGVATLPRGVYFVHVASGVGPARARVLVK